MKTDEKTLTTLMHLPQRLRVPLFQRPYAWSQEAQWEPLWQDLLHLMALPHDSEKHFLGAVVLQSGGVQPGGLPSWDVIDGQQRLTTLQILIDAVASVIEVEVDGGAHIASRLTTLTENHETFRTSVDDRFKLTPTTRDRLAFAEVMSASAPVDHSLLHHRDHALAKAHKYFVAQTRQLIESAAAGGRAAAAAALADIVLNRLEIVVISLDPAENAQAIFETMNARMTPLQPTDLIKNLLFQSASADGEDVEALYRSKWQRFEDSFWESEVTQGRLVRPRFTIFMNYWLISETGAAVSSGDVFRDFKRMLQAGARSTVEVLDVVINAAEAYRELLQGARRDGEIPPRELTVYRLLESDVGALWPVLLRLLQLERERPERAAAVDRSFALLESWVVRRVALGMTMSGANRQVVDILERLDDDAAGPDVSIEAYLRGLRGDSAVWPDDALIRDDLIERKIYTSLKRSRLRMILEALEDEARGFVSGHARISHSRMVRRATEVEHIMPASWRQHWPLGHDDDEVTRDRMVHTLGNLALLPQRFNASIQNIEWGAKDGDGKRAAFHKSSTDLLLHDVLERDVWDEAEIAARSEALVEAFIRTWPVPIAHSVPRAEPSGSRTNVVRELMEGGALREGDVLVGRGQDRGLQAVVTRDGGLIVGGARYNSPTAAAMAHKTSKGADSGNSFWRLGEGGPSLLDLRAQVLGFEAIRVGSSTTIVSKRWALLQIILRALPSGAWTTYGDVAKVIRSHANPVGQHIARNRVEHAWRVLQAGGTASPGFRWTSEEYRGADPMEILAAEGVAVVNGVADASRRLRSDGLRDLLDVEGLTLLADIEGTGGLSVAALADELSIRPEVIRVWLREKPGADSAKQGSEWVLDQGLADWVRERHASAEGNFD